MELGAPPEGKLKIFFGYAPGVGKTYAMLSAAREAMAGGADVAVGQIARHTKPDTLRLLEGMEMISPPEEGGELDLDGALKRKPGILLVDDLAHHNRDGSRHRKRYQDIQELLKAGIDVYTTMSVQQIESLIDIVSAITGSPAVERVPDRVFDLAKQVELVDLEPEDLIARLNQGKIFSEQMQKAFNHLYTREKLTALRELALRRTADRLNRRTSDEGIRTAEHILICLSPSPSNGRVIRAAARMAEAFHGRFTALYVETSSNHNRKEESLIRLKENIRLAEELGAHLATVYSDDVPSQIVEYAKASGVTKVVIGRSNTRKDILFYSKNLIDKLTEQASSLDIYVIPDIQKKPVFRMKVPSELGFHFSFLDLAKALLMIVMASVVGLFFYDAGFSEANIITVYILGVLFASAITNGRIYGALMSFVSVIVFNFLFTEPRFTLLAYDAGYPVTFFVMFIASFVTSTLTMQVKSQAKLAALKAYRTEVLLETNQKLQKAESFETILDETARQMIKLLGCTVLFYPARDGELGDPLLYPVQADRSMEAYLTKSEQTVALWVLKNNKYAGASTNTLPGARCLYFAVRGQRAVFAVASIGITEVGGIDSFDRDLLVAMLGETGLALEKITLSNAKQQAEVQAKQEQLRANLLRTISHDLRTPLTSISGNAGVLMNSAGILSDEKKQRLYTDIYDDAMWLINLVENLLSVTRIENGTLNLHLVPELLEEIFQESMRHLHRKAKNHRIETSLSDDLLIAKMDARLIVQVLINLIDNAIKYTPEGSVITVSAHRSGDMTVVEVKDDGPGISDEAKEKLFEMFYTASNNRGDGRRGMGLGLALCKAIITEHGGTIGVRDNDPHGAVFYFTLQVAEVNPIE